MNFAAGDLFFAIVHHVLVFSLVGVLALEFALARPGLTARDIARLVPIDTAYGIIAGLIVVVGFTRAIFFAKGWAYYSVNPFFWAKIGSFVAVGLLSILPTLKFLGWRREIRKSATALPGQESIAFVRRILWLEALGVMFVIMFAATMARFS